MKKVKEPMTPDEVLVLTGLLAYREKHGEMPLRTELAEELGISPQLAQYRLKRLEEKNHIRIKPLIKRGIEIL